MSSPNDLIDRISNLVPHWLGWPMSALSTLTAFTGAGLLFAAAAFAFSHVDADGGLVAAVSNSGGDPAAISAHPSGEGDEGAFDVDQGDGASDRDECRQRGRASAELSKRRTERRPAE